MQNKLDIAFEMRYTAPRMVLPSRAIPVRKEAGRSCCALKLNNKYIENKNEEDINRTSGTWNCRCSIY